MVAAGPGAGHGGRPTNAMQAAQGSSTLHIVSSDHLASLRAMNVSAAFGLALGKKAKPPPPNARKPAAVSQRLLSRSEVRKAKAVFIKS